MTVDRQTLAATRRALHGVAENVLAGPQYRHSGTIRLGVTESGFGTVRKPFLRVSGAELAAGDRKIPINGATCRELAAAAGIDAGAPEGLYGDGSGVGVDETLGVDAEAAQHIADVFDRGHAAATIRAGDVEHRFRGGAAFAPAARNHGRARLFHGSERPGGQRPDSRALTRAAAEPMCKDPMGSNRRSLCVLGLCWSSAAKPTR